MSKKEITKQIKEKINSDSDFKVFYNLLSEEDKKDYKDKIVSFNEIIKQIEKHHTENLTHLDEFCVLKLEEHLKTKYKKVYGKKARAYAHGKVFFYTYGNYYMGILPFYTKKHATYYAQHILEIPDPKGRIYVTLTNSNEGNLLESTIDVHTSHFFDRYKERLKLEGDRESVLKHFLSCGKQLNSSPVKINDETDEVIAYMKEGLALGVTLGNLILLKTFINNDQINGFQGKHKKNLEKSTKTVLEDYEEKLEKNKSIKFKSN